MQHFSTLLRFYYSGLSSLSSSVLIAHISLTIMYRGPFSLSLLLLTANLRLGLFLTQGGKREPVESMACVPVLAVLPVVVVSAVTDVSVGRAGLPVALRLVLTWVEMASVSAASSIVTCGERDTFPLLPVWAAQGRLCLWSSIREQILILKDML